jgi:hypothetical protein
MNSKRLLVIGSAAAMSMASFYTHATAGHIGLEACASAMVGELSASSGTHMGFQVDSSKDNFDRKLGVREVISLYARDPDSDELVARMDCVVDQRGRS